MTPRKNLSDVESLGGAAGAAHTSKSDELFDSTILVIDLKTCKKLTFPKSGAAIGGATLRCV